jgi:hypothetical protein
VLRVLRLEDLPRDDGSVPCDPEAHALPPGRNGDRVISGRILDLPRGPFARYAVLEFEVGKAQSVAVDGKPLSRAQLTKRATMRWTGGAHTVSYPLGGVAKSTIVAVGYEERRGVELPTQSAGGNDFSALCVRVGHRVSTHRRPRSPIHSYAKRKGLSARA